MKFSKQRIPIDRILYGFITLFNLVAFAMIFEFNTFIEQMLFVDMVIIVVIRFEKLFTAFVIAKYNLKLNNKK